MLNKPSKNMVNAGGAATPSAPGTAAAGSALAYSKEDHVHPRQVVVNSDIAADAAIAASKISGLANSATTDTTNASNITSGTLAEARIPTLNQSTTGTAANVTGVVAFLHGGTGSTDQQSALNALAVTKVAGTFLRGDGADVKMSAIQASDVPTLNQNTSGTAAGLSATLPVTSGGTGQTGYTNGQLLIGNTATGGLSKATLSAGSNIGITNGAGTVTIAYTGSPSGVTSFSGDATGLTPATAATGAVVLGGTLALTSGGTGAIAPHDALFNLGSPTHQANCRTTSNIVPTTVVGTFTTAGWVNGATTITLTAGNTASLAIGMVLGTSGLLSSSIVALPDSVTITLSSPATSTISVSTNLTFYNTTATMMTIAATGVQVFDGQTVAVGDVVAFTNQSALPLMGPWVCTTAGAVGVQPVYERPSWFTGTSASPVLMHIAKGLISIGQVYSIYPTVAATVNVGFVALASSLVSQRGTTAVLGANTFSSTQTFSPGTTGVVPAKFSTGSVLLSNPLSHAIEWDSSSMYVTAVVALAGTWASTGTTVTLTSGSTLSFPVGSSIASGISSATGTTLTVASILSATQFTLSANPTNTGTATPFTLAARRTLSTLDSNTYTGTRTFAVGTAAGLVPLKFQSGTLTATAQTGALEWDGQFYITNTNLSAGVTARGVLPLLASGTVSGASTITGATGVTPTTATSAGTVGQMAFDDSFLYLCVKTGSAGTALWKKTSLLSI